MYTIYQVVSPSRESLSFQSTRQKKGETFSCFDSSKEIKRKRNKIIKLEKKEDDNFLLGRSVKMSTGVITSSEFQIIANELLFSPKKVLKHALKDGSTVVHQLLRSVGQSVLLIYQGRPLQDIHNEMSREHLKLLMEGIERLNEKEKEEFKHHWNHFISSMFESALACHEKRPVASIVRQQGSMIKHAKFIGDILVRRHHHFRDPYVYLYHRHRRIPFVSFQRFPALIASRLSSFDSHQTTFTRLKDLKDYSISKNLVVFPGDIELLHEEYAVSQEIHFGDDDTMYYSTTQVGQNYLSETIMVDYFVPIYHKTSLYDILTSPDKTRILIQLDKEKSFYVRFVSSYETPTTEDFMRGVTTYKLKISDHSTLIFEFRGTHKALSRKGSYLLQVRVVTLIPSSFVPASSSSMKFLSANPDIFQESSEEVEGDMLSFTCAPLSIDVNRLSFSAQFPQFHKKRKQGLYIFPLEVPTQTDKLTISRVVPYWDGVLCIEGEDVLKNRVYFNSSEGSGVYQVKLGTEKFLVWCTESSISQFGYISRSAFPKFK